MRVAILTVLALFALCSSALAYDCRKPSVPVEYVVCSDKALIKLVNQRRDVYKAAHQRVDKKLQRILYADHWKWLNTYPSRCGIGKTGRPPMPIKPRIIACFKREYEARIAYLRAYPQSAAEMKANPAKIKKAEAEARERAKAEERARTEAKARAEARARVAAKARAEEEAKLRAEQEAKAEAAERAAAKARAAAEAAVEAARKAKAKAAEKARAEAAKKAHAKASAAPSATPKPAAAAPAATGKTTLAALPSAAESGAGTPGRESVPALPGSTAARYHLKFTFACRTRDELARVLQSLAKNDFSYALSQPDCLPVPDGRPASLLSLDGHVAQVRLCSPATGCTDVYADAASVLDAKGEPLGK